MSTVENFSALLSTISSIEHFEALIRTLELFRVLLITLSTIEHFEALLSNSEH